MKGQNFNMIERKNDLLQLQGFLSRDPDDYAIGMHMYGDTNIAGRLAKFRQQTGSTPAFIDYDMHSLPFADPANIASAEEQLAAFVDRGGFVTVTDHWLTPHRRLADAACEGANNSRDALTRDEYLSVMTAGTPLNKNFTEELKIKAQFLCRLRERGIPVIYRPLHEGNAGWFWWGIREEAGIMPQDTARLFRFVHDFFAVTHGLDNILWEFCPTVNDRRDVLCDWYPGDGYVDLLAMDWYLPEHDYAHYAARMQAECGKKPVAIAEFGGDGNYNTAAFPLKDTLMRAEQCMDRSAPLAYVGLYFDMPDGQDWTLSDRAIGLDKLLRTKEQLK